MLTSENLNLKGKRRRMPQNVVHLKFFTKSTVTKGFIAVKYFSQIPKLGDIPLNKRMQGRI